MLEHGLGQDGKPLVRSDGTIAEQEGSYDTFFTEAGPGKYVPRSIFVDLDPSVTGPRVEPWVRMLIRVTADR